MNDEHIRCLTGWVQGEEILEYIRRIERENALLVKELEEKNKALDNTCEMLSEFSGSCPLDMFNCYLNCEEKCNNQMKECWKEWSFKYDQKRVND